MQGQLSKLTSMYLGRRRVIDAETLITRILQGDQEAFRELVNHYSQHVFHTAYSVLRDAKEAEDASQEVFIQVYKALPSTDLKALKPGLHASR